MEMIIAYGTGFLTCAVLFIATHDFKMDWKNLAREQNDLIERQQDDIAKQKAMIARLMATRTDSD